MGSLQEESVNRVPQLTKLWISVRIDFSSMLCRRIALAGRGKLFTWGLPGGGSAGSRGGACCAKASPAANFSDRSAASPALLLSPWIVLLRLLMRSPPRANWLQKGRGILARTRRSRHPLEFLAALIRAHERLAAADFAGSVRGS
ncbi:MAG: hypothetical protein DMG42_00945 [Acidobacteria bacterium]|nr:MAG: hypothetical protein DMG42_00945 [Acidobacteriota bacterium]